MIGLLAALAHFKNGVVYNDMFLIYKIIIVGLTLSVLFYYFNIPYVYLYIITVVILYNEEVVHCLFWHTIVNSYLKVRDHKSQVKSFSHNTPYSDIQHSTPVMQNSFINTTRPTYSPISNSESRTRRLFNGVTSTPLSSPTSHKNSLFLSNKLTPLRSPPLYSLSELPTSVNKSPRAVQNISGPLLASTRFNVSLGTYTDTKSPGLSNRIVQYSNETKQKQAPTHQAKYGSPGLFPVVHFFKKDIPQISPKPRKVTVKIASPDTSWYSSPEYGNKKIANKSPNLQNGHNVAQTSADTETRSVLDALKEISRKRIHTSSDFESEQDVCKRQKRCEKNPNPSDTNKRTREDSPAPESPTKTSVQPSAKKICVVDLLAASFTSSQLFKEQLEKGSKKKIELESMEKIPNKQTKLFSVGTQTIEAKPVKNKETASKSSDKQIQEAREINKKKSLKSNSKPEDSYRYSNIFDDKKLEINRKNKLAILLSAITGEPPNLISYEKSKFAAVSESQPTTPPISNASPKLVSILSPQNKPKHDKHVTFNLPPDESDYVETTFSASKEIVTSEMSISTSSLTYVTTPTKSNLNLIGNIAQSETPKGVISDSMVTKLDFDMGNSNSINKEVEKKSNETLTTSAKETKETKAQPIGFSFKPLIQANPTTSASTSAFSFGTQNMTTSNIPTSNLSTISTPQSFNNINKDISTSLKSGGFKFDLNKSPIEIVSKTSNISSTTVSSNTPKFTFSPSQQRFPTESAQNTQTVFSTPQTTVPTLPTFSFGDNKLSNSQNSTTAIFSFSVSSGKSTSSNTTSTTPSAAKPTVTSSSNVITFDSTPQSFNNGNNNVYLSESATITSTTQVTSIPLGTSNTLTFGAPSSGQVSNSNLNTSSSGQIPSSTFGIPSTVPSCNSTFETPPPKLVSNSSFGIPSVGQASNTTFGSQSSGQATNSMFTVVPSITSSAQSANSPFGTTATSGSAGQSANSVFGKTFSNTPNFPPATTSTFGTGFTAMTTSTSTAGFGTPKSITSFGAPASNSTFGVSTTSSSFSSNSVFSSSAIVAPTFGSPAPPEQSFGTTTTGTSFIVTNPANQSFNTATTSSGSGFGNKSFAFGSNNNAGGNNVFNIAATKPSFNFTATTTSVSTTFNTKSVPSFGSTFSTPNVFGTSTTQSTNATITSSGIFKSPTTNFGNSMPQFGTKSENTFGVKPENTFGTFNNSFGSNNNTPVFGTNTNNNNSNIAFGTTSSNTFSANANNTSNFGSNPASTNAFAIAPNVTSTFRSNQNSGNMFGITPKTSTNVFESNSNVNNNNFNNNSVFNNTNMNPSNFGFNGGDNTSAFAKPQSSTAPFGNVASGDATFQFGSNSSQNFGTGNTNNVVPTPQLNVFAFGANNSSSTTPATNVFAFGTTETKPTFNFNAGSNPAPPFGVGAPNFNTGSTSTFNAGGPQFGNSGAVIFSMGSGSNPGTRSRAQLKAKRRI